MELNDRSMNDELAAGGYDGAYKRVNPDRGGHVEDTTARARAMLSDTYYGVHELASKVLGDGTVRHDPYARPTGPWQWGG